MQRWNGSEQTWQTPSAKLSQHVPITLALKRSPTSPAFGQSLEQEDIREKDSKEGGMGRDTERVRVRESRADEGINPPENENTERKKVLEMINHLHWDKLTSRGLISHLKHTHLYNRCVLQLLIWKCTYYDQLHTPSCSMRPLLQIRNLI